MKPTRNYNYPIIDHILHPTDFSEASLTAFYHALKAALIAKARLTLIHVTDKGSGELLDFPGVRAALERWELLPPGSSHSALQQLGIEVRKVVAGRRSPVEGVLKYLEQRPADLIVLATHQHEGRATWLQQRSVAKPIARRSGQMTLFISEGDAGFVSTADGSISLKNILIPVAEPPGPQPAVEAAARLVQRLNCPSGTFTLLHVGEASGMPAVQCPEIPGWEWKEQTRTGGIIQGIVDTAQMSQADLVVMSTDGRNGFLDALHGTHSERVLRTVPAPLLTVPAGPFAEQNLQAGAR
jgi:nucleotide-binding universal stress UspA family protein